MILFPLRKLYTITQGFGESFGGYYEKFDLKGHDGIDFGVPEGTPIYATHDGIIKTGDQGDKFYGKYIKLISESRESLYAHLSKFLVRNNTHVNQGDIIGYTGNTGGSTGEHLHFSFRSLKDGKIKNYNNGYKGRWDVIGNRLTFLAQNVKIKNNKYI